MDGTPRERLHEAMRSASLLPVRLPQLLATAVTHADTTPELLAAILEDVMAPRRRLIADRLAEGKSGGWLRPEADEWEVSSLITGLLVNEALGLVSFPSRAARGDALANALWRQTAIDPDSDGTISRSWPHSDEDSGS